ncbi:formyltransferase family protein, partial [Aestuariivita boseongensis]|uniref:formyltransferase family protein n=1 Tax=Aestuariivita boseongensis TaxID=1470562 RepID=UPI00247FEF98
MSVFSAIVIGDESLTISCSDMLMERGHRLTALVTRNPDVADWARAAGVTVLASPGDLNAGHSADWLFSIANLQLIPEDTLALGRKGAVNFHDGPLPAYAGLNAPVWALLNGETSYGVSWHLMEAGIDKGDLVATQPVPVNDDDTALSLNAKCYAAGMESFEGLITRIASGTMQRSPQDFTQRSYFGKNRRPVAAGRLNFNSPAVDLLRLHRAMEFGGYWNPLTRPKIDIGAGVLAVAQAKSEEGAGAPGTLLEVGADHVSVACAEGAIRLSGLTDLNGHALRVSDHL